MQQPGYGMQRAQPAYGMQQQPAGLGIPQQAAPMQPILAQSHGYGMQSHVQPVSQAPQGYGMVNVANSKSPTPQLQSAPKQNVDMSAFHYQSGTSDPNQYFYYHGGEAGKLEDITPTPQMVQVEEKHDYNEYQLHGSLSAPKLMEEALSTRGPTSPALLYTSKGSTYSMPVRSLVVRSELHIATGFVSMTITFQNTTNNKCDCLFVLPLQNGGTVTSTTVDINNGARFLETTFVDSAEAEQLASKSKKGKDKAAQDDTPAFEAYIPNLFRLPMAGIRPNETVRVRVDYMETLQFVAQRYHFYVPLNFGEGILPSYEAVRIECSINCLTPGIQYGSTTHQLVLRQQANRRCVVTAHPRRGQLHGPGAADCSGDFHLHYYCASNQISAALLFDERKHIFCAFINPPMVAEDVFHRDIVFMLDRSGSMTGKPFEDAVSALRCALDSLTANDRFAIIAFDHEQVIFGSEDNNPDNVPLFAANAQSIAQAANFLSSLQPRGMTDIATPLLAVMRSLNASAAQSIPFCVLLTDGAVKNEKHIVAEVERLPQNRVRVLTFGIGRYCNEYFLKRLSAETRGWNDGAVYPKDLFPKVTTMMERAKAPILCDVGIEFGDGQTPTLHPATVADLFVNGPLVISGEFRGKMPDRVLLTGRLKNGQKTAMQITPDRSSAVVPIADVLVRQQMDDLVAAHWLHGDDHTRQEIVELSLRRRVPSPYTTMVAYEMSAAEMEKSKREKGDDDEKEDHGRGRKSKKGLSGKQIAALGGGAVVIGAGVFLLGNVAATMGNLNIVDVMGNGLGDFGDMLGGVFGSIDCPCDACLDAISCGNLDCGAIANCSSCGACGDCDAILDVLPCGDCDGGCVELPGCGAIGDVCEGCGAVLGGCFGGIGDACGDCVGALGDLVGNCDCACIGDLCSSLGGIFGGLAGCLGDCGGAVCEVAGGMGECCGEIFGAIQDAL